MRIFETSRRHPGHGGPVAGSCCSSARSAARRRSRSAAVGLRARGRPLRRRRLPLDRGALRRRRRSCSRSCSSRARVRPLLARLAPLLAARRGSSGPCAPSTRRSTRTATTPRLLVGVFVLTLAVQAVRVLAIWAAAEAVGIDLSVARLLRDGAAASSSCCSCRSRSTGSRCARRSSSASSASSASPRDQAFAAGFLFFLVTIVLSLPGRVILAWENLRAVR